MSDSSRSSGWNVVSSEPEEGEEEVLVQTVPTDLAATDVPARNTPGDGHHPARTAVAVDSGTAKCARGVDIRFHDDISDHLEGSTSATSAAAPRADDLHEEEDAAVEVVAPMTIPSPPFVSDDNDATITPPDNMLHNINVSHADIPATAGGNNDAGRRVVGNATLLEDNEEGVEGEMPVQAVSNSAPAPTDLAATDVPATNTPGAGHPPARTVVAVDGATAKRPFASILFALAVATKPLAKWWCVSVLVAALLIAGAVPCAVNQWGRYVEANDKVHATSGTVRLSGSPNEKHNNNCTQFVPFPSPFDAAPRLFFDMSGFSLEAGYSIPTIFVTNISAHGVTFEFDCTPVLLMMSYMALDHARFPSIHFKKLPGQVNLTTHFVNSSGPGVYYRELDQFTSSSPTTIHAPSDESRDSGYDFYSSHWECVPRNTDKEVCQILYSSNPDVHVGVHRWKRGGSSDDTCSVAIRTPHHCDGELLTFASIRKESDMLGDLYRTVFTTNVTSNSFTLTQNCHKGSGCKGSVFYAAVCRQSNP